MLHLYAIVVDTRDETEPDGLDIEQIIDTLFEEFDSQHVVSVQGRDDTNREVPLALRPTHRRSNDR